MAWLPTISSRRQRARIALSWAWFFLVLLAYYCLKPLRDALASDLARNLGDLYLATFLITVVALSVYSQVVTIVSRRGLVIGVHQFFSVCLGVFWFLFQSGWRESLWLAAVFFVWVSVFNLFAVTLFWSVMADAYTVEEGKAWFGILAAAGSVGSISGSAIAYQLTLRIGPYGLILIAIVALELAVGVAILLFATMQRLSDPQGLASASSAPPSGASGTGGTIYAGLTHVLQSPYLIGICLFVALGKFAATFIYNNLQLLLELQLPDRADRTTLFSQMNLWSQSGSLMAQSLLVGGLMKRFGVGTALVLPCGLMLVYFLWLSYDAALMTLVVGQVGQQILGYGILVPAQHVLFTVVSREDKYKSKAFTDTVVFRGSDVAAGKVCDWITRSGTRLTSLSLAMLPVVLLWAAIGAWVGRRYAQRALTETS